jgi:Asp-tRNAAsn/Glu-tRNAGln amidotransferase A subunit and related amidases
VSKHEILFVFGFRGKGIRCGWSALAGQCQNPYVKGGDNPSDGLGGHSVSVIHSEVIEKKLLKLLQSTGGSSSGSAVAVAAGLAPIAIGTETEGSLVVPSTRAGLYTLKPTLGLIPGDGIIPINHRFDTAGPMAKCVCDIACLLSAIVDHSRTDVPEGGYASAVSGAEAWKDFTIGTLNPDDWLPPGGLINPVVEATEEIVGFRWNYTNIVTFLTAFSSAERP